VPADAKHSVETAEGRHRPWVRTLADVTERLGLLIAWAIVILIFGILEPDTFLTQANFATIFGSQAVLAVLTLGLLIPLTAGDFDLSFASVGVLAAMMVAVLNAQHGVPIGLAILSALAAGITAGFINGAIMAIFGIDPLIVTLGMGTFLSGITFWISGSYTVGGVSTTLTDAVTGTRFLDISVGFYVSVALCMAMWYFFERTMLGRRVLFVGRGRNVARLAGINVTRVRWGALIAVGGISAFAGVLYVGTVGGADPSSGLSFLLPAFSAAFLGATAFQPGKFNPWGSLVALFFLVTGINGLTILGVQAFVQDLFYGAALVLAVVLSQLARGRRERELS
jgi:ribose transport system permease protein